MKTLILLTIIACLLSATPGYSQTITLSLKQASLEKTLKEIRKQTGYTFVYTREQINKSKPVSISIKDASLNQALNICFANQPLTFTIEDKYIIVKDRPDKISPSVANVGLNVKGVVVDEQNEPVAGATVAVQGSNIAMATDEKGQFEFGNLKVDDILRVSSIGFQPSGVSIKGRNYIVVRLPTSIATLDETIIKGYYTTSKRLNTGSVSKVTGEEISRQPVSNPILALEGLVPGLLITQNNGLPGSRFTALIRGQSSIQNGNSPLFIIDGVPFLSDNDALTQLNGMLANSPFNSLDPNDIESIEVLKDADATAIYGSRGANGVILITTKKAKTEKNSLSLNISRGWGKVTRTMQLMNTQQYLEMRKEAFQNDSITPTNINAPDLISWDQNRFTDWKKLIIGGTANTYNAQLRYSGGNEFTKFSVGVGYYKETTIFPDNSGDKKSTVDINVNHKSTDGKLSIVFISSYAFDNLLLPSYSLTRIMSMPPNSYPLKDSLDNYTWREAGYSVGNPIASLTQINHNLTERLTANSTIFYRPNSSFEFKTNFGYNKVSANEKNLAPISSQDPAYAPNGLSSFGNNYVKIWIIEPQVSYKNNFQSSLEIETLIGSTFQKTESERELIQGSGYTNDELLGSISGASSVTASNGGFQYNYAAIFGRIGINWDNKYILNGTARRDGSSRFGPDNRFANFGAVGVAWIFSKESFIEKALPFLSLGKLRGSFGFTGNDQIGNYQYLDTYKGTLFRYDGQPGLTPSRLFNSNYSWEENKKLEIAVEARFFRDKVSLSFNYYKNKSSNQIIRYSLPTQTGFTDILLNFPGVVQNKGYEVSINAQIIKNKNLHWNASFNMSHNRNKLLSFPGLSNSSYASSYLIGKSLNVYRGLHFLGVDAQTGIYHFDDLNKDGKIDNDDFKDIGTTDPKFFGGLSNSFGYKSIQLNILLEFRKQLGRDLVYSYSGLVGSLQNQSIYVLDRWQKPGDITPYQKYSQDFRSPAFLAMSNLRQSDAILTDASFIRVRNIMVSYNLPPTWTRTLNMKNGKLFCQVQNLFTVTKYRGNDPESQSLASLPPLKMIVLGIQVNF